MANDGIGDRVLRKEDQRFITGRGRYTDDISLRHTTYAIFVRSPHAHARIKSIDIAAAVAAPGVAAVLTGADLAGDKIGGLICGWMIHSKDGSPMKAGAHPALAADVVRYVGDAVAMVIAETRNQARDAAERVVVEYEELPSVIDPAKAQDDGAPQIHPEAPRNTIFHWSIGGEAEADAALAKAAHVTRLDIVNNRVVPNAIEPRSAIATYEPSDGQFTLYYSTQNPHLHRLVLSAFVGIAPENKLRVIAPDVGGGFGSKIFVYAEETLCLWASKRMGGRPVKWTADRSESFLSDAHGRDHVTHAAMAFDASHKVIGLKVKTIANLGAYMSTFSSSVPTYLYGTLLSGQYNIPAIYAEVDAVYTNTVPVDAVRGAGRPEAAFVMERLMETAARELGEDPGELRRKNFIRTFPHQTPVAFNYDAGDYVATLDGALKMADYAGFAARKAEAAKRGKLRGIGFSSWIEACGIAPSALVGSLGAGVGLWESAEVRVNFVGTVEVLTGAHSHGQGHETTFAQLVNERLGIGIDKISIVHGDTDKVQFGMGTYGSRTAVGMSAIVKALDKVEDKAKKIAAHLLEASESDVVMENGELKVVGTDRKKTFSEIAMAAYTGHNLPPGMEPGLKEGAFYDPTNFTFPGGTYICEVEVDPKTGSVDIVQFAAADDFGTIINPIIVEGQIHGGIVHGIGQALLESATYDMQSGQLLSGSYMDYAMPRADDVPSFKIMTTVTLCPSNPIGMKGCGEAGAIGSPPAVINAITDAIGNNDLSMPATPEKVWLALQKGSARASTG
jgi:aerobic carbon-monoxide dehydrogenase large subunit